MDLPIKPLSWSVSPSSLHAHAFGIHGFYRIVGGPGHWDLMSPKVTAFEVDGPFETQAAARGAAETDHEKRIRAELKE